MTDNLDARIDAAIEREGGSDGCQKIGNCETEEADPKSQFRVELEQALWLAIDGGMTLAEILGEVRRTALDTAADCFGGDKKAARKILGIGITTMYRIENNGNKF